MKGRMVEGMELCSVIWKDGRLDKFGRKKGWSCVEE